MRGVTHKAKGFSLIEVMISLALGLVVVMLVIQLFINAKNNHAQNDRVSETLESGRYALKQLSTDLKEAGFFGGVLETANVSQDGGGSLPAVAPECGNSSETNWAYDVDTYRSIQYDDYSINTNEVPPTDHICIDATHYRKGTDALVVKRVINTPFKTAATTTPLTAFTTTNTPLAPYPNTVFLRSNFSTACLWYYDGSAANPTGANCPPIGASTFDWQYTVNVYYIRDYYQTKGDGIPTLCRESLSGAAMQPVCLAPGVEGFHVMFGIDTDNPHDGIANVYISDPTPLKQLRNRVVSARIYVLVRAQQEDSKFVDSKIYHAGDLAVGPFNDKYYRRMYSTTVILRNPLYSAAFNSY